MLPKTRPRLSRRVVWCLAAALVWPAAAKVQAGSASSAGQGDPADPAAAVPALTWRSALKGLRIAHEPARVDWRAANDTVTRIGGWRAYAREAQEPAVPATTLPSAAQGSHGSHGSHGAPVIQGTEGGHRRP
jgi:hypothetical protein